MTPDLLSALRETPGCETKCVLDNGIHARHFMASEWASRCDACLTRLAEAVRRVTLEGLAARLGSLSGLERAALVGPLWNAINVYVVACNGDPAKHVYGNTPRQRAVADVEQAVREFVSVLAALRSETPR